MTEDGEQDNDFAQLLFHFQKSEPSLVLNFLIFCKNVNVLTFSEFQKMCCPLAFFEFAA